MADTPIGWYCQKLLVETAPAGTIVYSIWLFIYSLMPFITGRICLKKHDDASLFPHQLAAANEVKDEV
ncbi:MAG: hypothetical protein CMN81_02720 [Spongiibacter sp.]|nr:hypothetical protein [Spongiibacter sp.]